MFTNTILKMIFIMFFLVQEYNLSVEMEGGEKRIIKNFYKLLRLIYWSNYLVFVYIIFLCYMFLQYSLLILATVWP